MLQLSDLGDGKTEWNLNETHIIIPIVENQLEKDETSKNTITLNSIDGTDEAIISNAAGQTFLIGLNRSIFEQDKTTGDLILIQQSTDTRCASSSKDTNSYSLSFVDDMKSDMGWTNLRKQNFLSNDKQNIETVLTKNPMLDWREDKTNELILDGNLILNEETKLIDGKNEEYGLDNEVIANNISLNKSIATKTNYELFPVSIDSSSGILHKNSLELSRVDTKDENIEDHIPKTIITNKINKLEPKVIYIQPDTQDAIMYNSIWMKPMECDVLSDVNASLDDKVPTNCYDNSLKLKPKELTTILKTNEVDYNVNCNQPNENLNLLIPQEASSIEYIPQTITSLSENSLPLKKKAKMKNTEAEFTLTSPSTSSQVIGNTIYAKPYEKHPPESKLYECSDSNTQAAVKRKKPQSKQTKEKTKVIHDEGITDSESDEERAKVTERTKKMVTSWEVPDMKSYKSIYEVIEDLKKRKFINNSLADLLTNGLKEMKVDILKEIISKSEEKSNMTKFSTSLLSFALMVYFKRPVAFQHLQDIFQQGWPSLQSIKDWKNSYNENIRQRNKLKTYKNT